MILKEPEKKEIIIGASQGEMFSIDSDNSVIFEILRNKMYSNKIAAVAREVASNSRDANREAKVNTPIQIEFTNNNILSSIGDTSIIFRDNGIGISPDRMKDIFLKYGASTKRTTNEQTGGFGLGAKTPFAYTDSFVVQTINNGICYIYSAIIDATGKGKMILLSEEPTENPSGTEIIVPILTNNDRAEFEREVYNATMYWDNIEYINFQTQKPHVKTILEGDSFKITHYTKANFVGLLDGIPYEIKPDGFNGINGYTVFLNLDLDKLTINANRESLQYDEDTRAHVNEKAKEFSDKLASIFETYLCDNEDYSSAYKKFKRISSRYHSNDDTLENLMQRAGDAGYKFSKAVIFKGKQVEKITLEQHYILLAKSVTNGYKYSAKSFTPEVPVVYLDKGSIRLNKNEKIGDEFLLIKPSKDKTADPVKIKEELDFLIGLGVEIIKYSEVKPDRESTKKPNSDKTRIFLRNLIDPYEMKLETTFDKTLKVITRYSVADTLVIPVRAFDNKNYYYHSSSNTNYFRYNFWKDRYRLIKIEKGYKNFFYVTQTVYDKYLKEAGYKTVEEVFSEIDLTKYSSRVEQSDILYALGEIPKIILENFEDLLPKSIINFKRQNIKKVNDELNLIDWEKLGVPKSKFDYEGVISKFNKNLETKYPMLLPYLNNNRHSKEEIVRNIKKYISCY